MAELTYGDLPVAIDPLAWFGRRYTPPLALDAGTIQSAILTQLQTYFSTNGLSQIAVYGFPNTDVDTWWNSRAIAFVLLDYPGSRLGKPLDTDTMVQERTLEFEVIVLARQTAWALLGAGSAFALLDAIEAALTGFRPAGCRNSYFTDERFVERDPEGRIWKYRMAYEVITLRPKLLPQYALANLSQIVNMIGDGDGAVPVTMVIPETAVLALPPNTLILSVATSAGVAAKLGADYSYDAVSGAFAVIPGGILAPGMTVAIASAPAVDIQTIS